MTWKGLEYVYFVSSTQIYNIVKVLELNILVNNLIGMCSIRIFENNLLALVIPLV